jgi:hypothetical protein
VAGSRREYLAADKLKIYITVKLSSATDAYRGFDVDDRPKFYVAIIYEDGAAGKAFLRSSDSAFGLLVALAVWRLVVRDAMSRTGLCLYLVLMLLASGFIAAAGYFK